MSESLRTKIGLFLAKSMAIAAVLLSTVFLHRMAGFGARCFSSQIIDRLVLFSERQEVPNCRRALTDLALGSDLNDSASDKWVRWAPTMDRLLDLWPKSRARGLAVVIVNEEPFALYQEGSHLMMGGAWTFSRRQWTNLVATAWLDQATRGMITLEKQILGEFLVSIANGEHELAGLDKSTMIDADITWASTALSTQDYCQSPWRRPEELELCTTEHGENFRPILGRGLWLIYQRADWRGRRELLNWLTSQVAQGSDSLLAAQPDQDNSIEWIKSELSRWSEKAQLPNDLVFTQSLWLRLGLIQAEKPFVVVQSNIPDQLVLDATEPLLFANQDHWTWVGSAGRVTPPNHEFLPQHMVKVVCKKPAMDQLDELAEHTVLLIMACDPNVLKGWDLLARRQIKAFIAENPERPMIWLNVAGLRRTLSDDPTKQSAQPISLKRLRRMSHWKEDLWDKTSHAFIPRAAVDLVLSHRASRELL